MGEIIDFNQVIITKEYNSLQVWRLALYKELESNGYTPTIPDDFFPGSEVDQSKDLFQLDSKVFELTPGSKIVLFRNHHFEIFFYLSFDKKLTLRLGTVATGLDAILLQQKFGEEKKIIDKYFKLMQDIFCK